MISVVSLRRFVLPLVLILLALTAVQARANPTLVIENGLLVGADGVDVGGALYDVRFVDGRCAEVFASCDSSSIFAFASLGAAIAASESLLEHVLIDTSLGYFDSDPTLVRGCKDFPCFFLTPVAVSSGSVIGGCAENMPFGSADQVCYFGSLIENDTSNFGPSEAVWATWSHHRFSVSEPGTIALLALTLVSLVLCRRFYRGWVELEHIPTSRMG